MYPVTAATFALVIGFRLLQLILFDNGRELKFTHGKLEISADAAPGALVEHNNDTYIELLKMDIEAGERYFLIPFLERYKVCQVLVEVHGKPSVHVSLLSRIAKLNYALFSHDVAPHAAAACEYSFIHLDCMQAYGAYMLKRYLNNVKVPQCSQQKHFFLIPFQC
ncbi:hypothetical protein GCK32_010028 [Trichostrongylus colubriformis]|uniref:Methyltransferase FkbM domain-containing protein n=1 Tax=Trichostrongylus colubriformis TaxID=6319 RepID=A0AAN8II95_TRICO